MEQFSFFNIVINVQNDARRERQRQRYRLNFPLFTFHLKILIVNFDKSPTFHAWINHHGVKLHHFRGLELELAGLGGWRGGGVGEVKNVNK